jgi:Uma2 family endonuclease
MRIGALVDVSVELLSWSVMIAPVHVVRYSYADFLRVEADSPNVKHEYVAGQIFAMAGGTPEHARIITDVVLWLGSALKGGPCKVYTSDLRIRIDSADVTTYPDVSVVCGAPQRSAMDPNGITNPALLVEVTSDSTESYDRTEKLAYYQSLESVREVLIVSHRERRLTLHQRVPEKPSNPQEPRGALPRGFQTFEITKDGVPQRMVSIGADVRLEDVYQ